VLLAGRPVLDPNNTSAAAFAGWVPGGNPCDGTWAGVTCAGSPRVVTVVNVRSRSLSGGLPAVWSQLPGLTQLLLNGNHLKGDLPDAWSDLTALQVRLPLSKCKPCMIP
jgi:hypothetical protein